MASTYISRSISGSPTNPDKFTISFWVKRCKLGAEQTIMGQYASANFRGKLGFVGDDRIEYIQKNDGNTTANLITTRKFRDTNAWYHIVVQFDTSQGTSSNRIKIYVNGVQETAFDTASYPAQDLDMRLNQASGTLNIGQDGNSSNYCDFVLSHFHLVDGATEAPTVFGETDSTTGEWKIKTSPSISEYGDDGFFILKDGNSVTDQSGKSNNFTVGGGTLTKTEDCPSDVFNTFNPLPRSYSGSAALTNGNTTITNTQDWTNQVACMGAVAGKYYWEMKIDNVSSNVFVGVCGEDYIHDCYDLYNDSTPYDQDTGLVLYFTSGRKTVNGTDTESHYASYATGDIIGVALDLDAGTKTVTFYKNGTVDPAGATNLPTNMQTGFVFPIAFVNAGSNASKVSFNAGNGYFGTSAVSSAGTNASNIGIFEYNVPANHTALSTKGLNE